MVNDGQVSIFISSVHYGLEDLRGELCRFIEDDLGALAFLSSENGFPDYPNLPPYAQCLKVMESCLITIGIIDRRYGQQFAEWGEYSQYRDLSPTHAELRHALSERKRLFLFVRDDVYSYYDIYRKNKESFSDLVLPSGLDLLSLKLLEEMKKHTPAPWIEGFKDIRDIKKAFQKRLLSDLAQSLKDKERISRDCMERAIFPSENDIDTIEAINPIVVQEQFTIGKVGIDLNSLRGLVARGQTISIAQYFYLVKEGMLIARHIFGKRKKGVASQGRADYDSFVYSWKPSADIEFKRGRYDVKKLPAPRDAVFQVIVTTDEAHPELIGMIQRWGWVQEDDALSEAPKGWGEGHERLVFSQ